MFYGDWVIEFFEGFGVVVISKNVFYVVIVDEKWKFFGV